MQIAVPHSHIKKLEKQIDRESQKSTGATSKLHMTRSTYSGIAVLNITISLSSAKSIKSMHAATSDEEV